MKVTVASIRSRWQHLIALYRGKDLSHLVGPVTVLLAVWGFSEHRIEAYTSGRKKQGLTLLLVILAWDKLSAVLLYTLLENLKIRISSIQLAFCLWVQLYNWTGKAKPFLHTHMVTVIENTLLENPDYVAQLHFQRPVKHIEQPRASNKISDFSLSLCGYWS